MSEKTGKNKIWRLLWPDVSTPAAARSAKMYGVWAAVTTAVITALFASWSLGSGKLAYEFVGPWAFIDVAVFVAVAFGIYKESRFAAVAGLVIFLGEKGYQIAVITTTITSGIVFAFLLTMCYMIAIRGTYALHRLRDVGIMDDKTAIKDARSHPDLESHLRVQPFLKWAWTLLAFGLVLDAFSTQLFYDVPMLKGEGLIMRAAYALGNLAGNIPVILIVGVIVAALARVTFVRTISLRLFVVSLALASVLDALLIHPIFLAVFR